MKTAYKKTKALSKLYLLVLEPIQTDFRWSFGGNFKCREMVKKWVFDFYLIGFCRPAHISIYRVKEHKILSGKLLFSKIIRSNQRSVFGVEKSIFRSKVDIFRLKWNFRHFSRFSKIWIWNVFQLSFSCWLRGKYQKFKKIHL
jgi:hypothetical protein